MAYSDQLRQNQVKGGSGWTDERVTILKQLWKDGLSASQIAKALGGVSRNAVIGKVHQLNLQTYRTRPSLLKVIKSEREIIKIKRQSAKSVVKKPAKRKRLPKAPPAPVAPLRLKVEDLTTATCKWPVTDKLPHEFCGHPVEPGKPYCEHHNCCAEGKPTRPA